MPLGPLTSILCPLLNQSSLIPSLSGAGITTGGSSSRMPSCSGGGTSTGRAAALATASGAGNTCCGWGRDCGQGCCCTAATGRGCGRGSGNRYGTGWGAKPYGLPYGYELKVGRPPTGTQPVGVHPAPERPGISVNHRATPATTVPGSPTHRTALRIHPASVRTRGRESFPTAPHVIPSTPVPRKPQLPGSRPCSRSTSRSRWRRVETHPLFSFAS